MSARVCGAILKYNREMKADIETIRLAVRVLSVVARADEMINWAVERLMEGDESPATVELAALDPVSSRKEDTLPIFSRAVTAKGIRLEDHESVLKAYFECIVREIASGNLDPLVGTERIREEIMPTVLWDASFAGDRRWYDESLRDWNLRHGGIDPVDFSEIPQKELPTVIRDAAARMLDSASADQREVRP